MPSLFLCLYGYFKIPIRFYIGVFHYLFCEQWSRSMVFNLFNNAAHFISNKIFVAHQFIHYVRGGQIAARELHVTLVIVVCGSRSYLQKAKYFNFFVYICKKKILLHGYEAIVYRIKKKKKLFI
jgi:hypothetical protein